MNLSDESDVIDRVAEELNLPPEQVKFVVSQLWKSVKYYLSNPHLVRSGIFLKGFARIRLSVQRLEFFLKAAMFSGDPERAQHPKLDYIKEILITRHNKYDKRKKSAEDRIQKRARLEEYLGRERCYVQTEEGTFDLLHYAERKRLGKDYPKRIDNESDKSK